FDMFLNITQAKVLRYQQAPNVATIEKSWFVETKTGVAMTILSVLIPIVAKTAHLILGIVARDPDNLDGLSCDTSSCRWMTGLSFAGLFALPAVGINGYLGHVRSELYESSLMVTSGFTRVFKNVTGKVCPPPISEKVDAHGLDDGLMLIGQFEG
ncbi:MAG: hypothetical protein CMF39_00590, partial [Legionellaceae bacterium]|nr:hypothetical protein [Legionellaceae bacterium]